MENFVAIDFETANSNRSSICQIGIVIVEDGNVVYENDWLVQPNPNYYDDRNTDIHGYTYSDTEFEDTFPSVWEEIEELIDGFPLVAHNCSFEESCLIAVFDSYGMEYPGYEFYCTYRAAKNYFGNSLPNFRLDTVAERCGYELENHHDALEDAKACAAIALEIL
jgi:DNA polymerase-3 subunit epsilon